MVAGSFTMEKQNPAIIETAHTVPQVELKPKVDRRGVALISWASVVTAILLVVLIFGAVYVTELKARECTTSAPTEQERKTQDYSRKYVNKEDGSEEKEDIHVDEADQTTLIVTKDDNGNINLIASIDYATKISAAYVPSVDECYLIAGENADHWDSWGNEKNKTELILPEDVFEEDYKSSGNKVTDLSILPKTIKPYCSGKATYWVQLADGTDDDDKEKRRVCRRFWYCYYYSCGRGRICRRCYYIIRCN